MSNWEQPKDMSDRSMDVALIIIFALGIGTWICYFMFVAGAGSATQLFR